MARHARRLVDVQQRQAEELRAGGRAGRRRTPAGGLDHNELVSAVCEKFCEGHPPAEIIELIAKERDVTLRREDPYRMLCQAGAQGWMRYVAPFETALRAEIRKRCPWLLDLDVVHTGVYEDVAYHGAEMLVQMLRRLALTKEAVHIGFAGGHAMRKLAKALAQLLRQPTEGLPKVVVFHAMVAGFNVDDPTTGPNTFFTYFLKDPAMQVETRFVGLHAPSLVTNGQFVSLQKMEGISECFAARKELDIIVTSASIWTDEHSLLRSYMRKSKASIKALEDAGCLGDMLWRPLGPDGPLEIKTDIRAMTLMELSDLPKFIQAGKQVLLTVGPCGGCHRPKDEVIELILNIKPPLITHLVVDSRSARGMVRPAAARPGGGATP